MDTRLRWWDRLNRLIFPFMGPAQLGPGPAGERPAAVPLSTCPICGGEMSRHTVERTADQHTATRLVCPPAA